MIATGYAGYRNAMANTTESKEEILLMLYEGALISLRIARRGIREKKPKLKGENISKVMAILTELDCALDRENGIDLADKISALYGYMMNRLTTANIKNDSEPLDEVEQLMGELYEGFKGAAAQIANGSVQVGKNEPAMMRGVSIAI
jgi:flagellar secretion chaperone FliS